MTVKKMDLFRIFQEKMATAWCQSNNYKYIGRLDRFQFIYKNGVFENVIKYSFEDLPPYLDGIPIQEYIDKELKVEDVNQWQTIESAPKDGTEILVKDGEGVINHVSWQSEIGGSWRMMSDTDLYLNPRFQIKWIPIPPEQQ